MNKKEMMIDEVLRIVVEECTVTCDESSKVTAEDIRGKCKRENVVMTRCIFATQMMFAGFSATTVAAYLHISEQGVSRLLSAAHDYRVRSWAYRIAEAESTLKCKKLMGL